MVRRVKVRSLDSVADLSAAIYAETAIGVRAALDATLPLAGGTVTGDLIFANNAAIAAANSAVSFGSKLTLKAGSGVGDAGDAGGHGHVEILGGGVTSSWSAFAGPNARRRGGVLIQAGVAVAGGVSPYVTGGILQLQGQSGTNNGSSVGAGSSVSILAGHTLALDGEFVNGASIAAHGGAVSAAGSLGIAAGSSSSASTPNAGEVSIKAGDVLDASRGAAGDVIITAGSAAYYGSLKAGSIILAPGLMGGDASGGVYVRKDNLGGTLFEILNKSMAGEPGGYASIDAVTGHIPLEQLPIADALSAANKLGEFDTPEKRADARANLGFAALETYGPPTRTISTDAPSGIPLDGAEWIVVVE